ncbi:acyl-CoA dehydrogenase family protein [Celeribacter sp. SCSIO 80788]|uniref:acyl-CoA dehydrogenase family protein n=1 Tax=Celeribacter sp. SCSIO 80788 TaxID=3117013 RepID=UPI003DA4F045
MNLDFSPEDRAFFARVQDRLSSALPEDIAAAIRSNLPPSKEEMLRWQDVLAAENWLAAGWPAEHGGPGLTPTQRYLFEQAYGALYAPPPVQFGITMVGPILYTYGSDEQKQRFLPPIRENRTWWCQGYSEPGAGSDLASLRTTAVLDGDSYVVNGQKTWTTWAQWADWMFCLVKTDLTVKPQAGISFLLIDMKTPGITVRPIRTLDGDTEINEVFLDNVRVPVENRIGGEGQGWTYAKVLLEHERFIMSGAARSRRDLTALQALDQGAFSARIEALDTELLALEYLELRLLSAMNAGGNPGPRTSALKIRGTEITQAISKLRLDMARDWGGEKPEVLQNAESNWLNLRKLTIWGGSNEIQRNVMAKVVLGI